MIDTSSLILLLQQLGLSKREAEIYLALLELNEALPSVIAKKVGQKRPTCYVTLEKLQARGLSPTDVMDALEVSDTILSAEVY